MKTVERFKYIKIPVKIKLFSQFVSADKRECDVPGVDLLFLICYCMFFFLPSPLELPSTHIYTQPPFCVCVWPPDILYVCTFLQLCACVCEEVAVFVSAFCCICFCVPQAFSPCVFNRNCFGSILPLSPSNSLPVFPKRFFLYTFSFTHPSFLFPWRQ